MFDDSKIKYLEMIQSVISRMASNSFVLKGWLITLITAVCIISFSSGSKYLFLLVFVPIVAFWLLDSYYLQLERKYRKLYEQVLDIDPADITFSLRPPVSNKAQKTNYSSCVFSVTEAGFYCPTALVALVILLSFTLC